MSCRNSFEPDCLGGIRPKRNLLRVARGRLLIAQHAAVNGMRPDQILCQYEELSADNARNQFLKGALSAIRPWAEECGEGRRWLELNFAFDGVSSIRSPLSLSPGLLQSRLTRHYEPATRWALLILRLLSPNVRAGADSAPEMLFNMNRLFEEGVAKSLELTFGSSVEVASQDFSCHLADTEEGEGVFRLRPDIVLRRGGEVVAVLDTKWTRIFPDSRGRLIPDESHAYQVSAYAHAFDCRDVCLIYPWHEGVIAARPSPFILRGSGGEKSRIHVLCVDVSSDGFPPRHNDFSWFDVAHDRRGG